MLVDISDELSDKIKVLVCEYGQVKPNGFSMCVYNKNDASNMYLYIYNLYVCIIIIIYTTQRLCTSFLLVTKMMMMMILMVFGRFCYYGVPCALYRQKKN